VADDERDNAGVVAPPPLIYLAPLILGLLLKRRMRVPFLPQAATRPLGWPLISGGALLLGWFFWTMWRADKPADPRKPVSRLVTSGPFRHTRNPAYLADAMIYVGISSLANALPAVLLLPVALVVIQRGVIEREERYLERTLGEEYLNYKASVRRWV
jgi:protein-S-isoprenylcysteine O-methyltransferase Ste14